MTRHSLFSCLENILKFRKDFFFIHILISRTFRKILWNSWWCSSVKNTYKWGIYWNTLNVLRKSTLRTYLRMDKVIGRGLYKLKKRWNKFQGQLKLCFTAICCKNFDHQFSAQFFFNKKGPLQSSRRLFFYILVGFGT